jgi:hypothetical protein
MDDGIDLRQSILANAVTIKQARMMRICSVFPLETA